MKYLYCIFIVPIIGSLALILLLLAIPKVIFSYLYEKVLVFLETILDNLPNG